MKKLKKFSLLLLVLIMIFSSSNVYSYAIDEDLLLQVNFDENVQDLSGNENHGKIKGDIEYVDGVKGKAVHITNSNGSTSAKAEQYIDFGKNIKFTNQDFAISFWYKSDNGVNAGGALISNKDFNSGANKGLNIGDFDTGLRVNFTPESSNRYDVYNFAPIDGIWHHVAVNFDRDGYIETYLDGKSTGKTDISNAVDKDIDVANFVVGADGYFKNGLNNAYLDELKVYSKLMSKEEILADYELNDDEILHLSFNDENANDVSGNGNHGEAFDVTYEQGVDGKAAHIVNANGSSSKKAASYINLGDQIDFSTNDFTISFWYKSNVGNENGGTIISNKDYDSGVNDGFAIGSFTKEICANFAFGGSRKDIKFTPIDGLWHHNVITFDRDGKMITYTDGAKSGEADISKYANDNINLGDLVIGADRNKCYGLLDSYLDEVKVFTSVKSGYEVEKLYQEFKTVIGDRLLSASFDGNVEDASGNHNNGKIQGNVEYVDGVKGKAVHITNSNGSTSAKAEQYIDFGKNIKFTNQDFAISFWYKSDNGVNAGGALISNKDFNSGANKGLNIGDFDTGLRVNFTPESSNRYDVYNFAPIDGIWHHVAVNFDRDGYIETYLDGKSTGKTDISNAVDKDIDVANFVVGADGYFKNGLNNAYLDELDVYNRLMDINEIKLQYDRTYLQYIVNEADKFYQEASENIKYDQAKLAALKEVINKAKVAIENNDYSNITILVNDINDKINDAKEGVEGVINGQVLYLSFDNENTNDDSGRENHGAGVGDLSYENGVIGKAIHIQNENGSTMQTAKQYINFGQPDDLKFKTEDFAISFWYKTVDGGGKEAAIISNKDWSTGGNVGVNIGNFGDSIRVNYTGEDCSRDDIYGLSANDDNWHYIVVNFDRDNQISAYIDGNLEKTVSIKDTYGKTTDATDFVIGADGNTTQGINIAYLDEVRVMKRLFTETEIDNYYLPYRLKMKLAEYTQILNEAKESGYEQEKINEFEKVINEVNEAKDSADSTTMRKLIKKLTLAFDRFQITETPIMSFQVLSDVHIDGSDDNNKSRQNLIDALEDISVLDPTSSAIMFPGDITDSGSEAQYKSFYNIIEKYNFTKSIIALGNHDVRWLCSGDDRNEPGANIPTCKYGTSPFKERYLKYNTPYMDGTTDQLYFDTWINNYHFITLNTEKDLKDNAYLSNEQLNWLKDVIKEGAHKDKPIFIQIHQTFTNTADHESLDLIGEQEEALKEILKDYPQSIIFTGHVHNGIDLAKVYQEEYGYVVDVPAFKYQSYGDSRAQIGYQVNVFEDRVEIRPRDYKNDLWLDEYKTDILFDKEIDKTALQTLYDECLTLKENEYTNESWSSFKTAMDEAKAIIDKQDATQEEVDNAVKTLQAAKDALVKVVVGSDKTALKIAIDLANAITDEDLANVVSAVADEFKVARDEANAVYNDATASQEQVNNAFDRLANAMHMLDFKQGDKTALKAFIDKVSGLEAAKYTEATWTVFETELNEAVAVYEDLNAMQEEVNTAYSELVTAFLNLRLIPDKSLLEDLINQAEGLDSANYTKASYAVVENALLTAKAVYENPNATQEEVNSAKDVLEKAINSLEANTTTPVDNTAKTPVNNGDTTASVKTGDDALVGTLAGLALLSVAGYVVLRRKQN